MSELYRNRTSDIPATPDPDYVYEAVNYFDRLLSSVDQLPEGPDKDLVAALVERRSATEPIVPSLYVERLFEFSKAQKFIDEIVVYDEDGRLNIDRTSAKLGIPCVFSADDGLVPVRGYTEGLNQDIPVKIYLNPDEHCRQDINMTFGHEVGHCFYRLVMPKILGVDGEPDAEESFCEYFGRAMSVSLEYIDADEVIDENFIVGAMARLQVNLETIVVRLMECDMLPSRIALDTYIPDVQNPHFANKVARHYICMHCTKTGGDYNCPHAQEDTILYNFTDRAWSLRQSVGCLGEPKLGPREYSTLTKHYEANETQLVLFRPE